MFMFVQDADMFSPEYQNNRDKFEIGSNMITVTHSSDYNAYKVINMQVRSIENQEVCVCLV